MRVTSKEKYTRIDARRLIPGRGDPIDQGTVIFSGSSIAWAGATGQLPDEFDSLKIDFKVPVLMPGMWDCHVHFLGATQFNLDSFATNNQAVAGARAVRDVAATLNAGFTSVRELAGYGVQLAQVIKEGWIPGPNIYSSVSLLSQTAGHGDVRSLPLEELCDRINHGLPAQLCDGADECIKAVRVQIRRGATLVKVAASGGVTSVGDDIQMMQFSDEELAAIVKEAAKNNMVVAAHAHGRAGIEAALRAGCRTIEHGTFLDDDALIDLMVEKGAMLVATRGVGEYVISDPSAFDPEQYQQALEIQKHHREAYRKAIKAGIKCAIGTDLGVSSLQKSWNHGTNGREFKYAVEAGMSPLQAIEAGTANAPDSLGPRAPKSGQLRAGFDADFIVLSADPLDDITILGDPTKVLHVWKGGKLYKKDGKPISLLNTTGSGSVEEPIIQ